MGLSVARQLVEKGANVVIVAREAVGRHSTYLNRILSMCSVVEREGTPGSWQDYSSFFSFNSSHLPNLYGLPYNLFLNLTAINSIIYDSLITP